MRSLATRCAPVALALALAACGGANQSGTSQQPIVRSVQGAVVKGPLVGATVSFFHVDGDGLPQGPAIATAVTDAHGHVATGLPQVDFPILAVSSGGSYVDEADDAGGDNRRRITLAPTQGFEAIVPANADTFVLTPYSMALLLRARRLAEGNFLPVYQALRQQAIEVLGFDPTAVIPADPLAPHDGGDARYGLLLGGAAYAIGTIATNLGTMPNYAIVRAFIDDLSDGALDGKVDDTDLQLKVQSIGDVDLNGEIVRFRNNHFQLYDGVPLVQIDETAWSAEPTIPDVLPPQASSDAIAVLEGGTATSLIGGATSVLANDTDPQDAPLTAELVTPPAHGSLMLNTDGTFVYVHDGSETTSDQFIYKARNGGHGSLPATVTITITPVNELPVAVGDGYVVETGQILQVNPPGVLFNDLDADGDELTAVVVDQPAHGTLLFDADGGFRYTPGPSFVGAESFTYRASDGQGLSNKVTVNIQVLSNNHPPAAEDDSYQAQQGSTLTVPAPGILANDSDPDGDALDVILVSPPAVGALVLTPQGSFSYTPPATFSGGTSFQYKLNDGLADSNIATVHISVRAGTANRPPIGVPDSYTWTGGVLTVPAPGVLANDSDPDGDPITAQLVSTTSLGTLTFHANGSFEYIFGVSDKARHAKCAGCSDQFTYRVSDGQATSGLVTVTIKISPPNQAPTGQADSYTVGFGGTLTIAAPGVLANDSDPDGDAISAELLTNPTKGTLTFNADGSFQYTHVPPPPSKAQAKAAIQDQFTYRVTDGDLFSAAVTVTITINRAPFGIDDSYTVNAGGTLNVAAPGVLGNDGDADGDPVTAVLVGSPTLGTLTFNADGSFQYQNTSAGSSDQFTYRVSDGSMQSSLVTVTITINGLPTGASDDYFASPGQVLVIDAASGVLANDSDPDAGDTITAVLESGPTKGTLILNADGSFMYQPFAGTTSGDTDAFSYRVSDGSAQSDPITVTVDYFDCDCSFPQGRHSPVLTSDGQTVVFLSADQTLVPGKTTGDVDIFVTTFSSAIAARASQAKVSINGGTTIRLMAADVGPNDGDVTTGAEPNGSVLYLNVTPDGHYVVFTTYASNYGLTTVGFSYQVYRYSLMAPDAGEIVLVSSKDGSPAVGNGFSNISETISDNGQFVAFQSSSSDLTSFTIDTINSPQHVYLRDITNTETTLVSVTTCGGAPAERSAAVSSISADGNRISFESDAGDMTGGCAKSAKVLTHMQSFVRDVGAGTTFVASVDSGGISGDGDSVRSWLSPDGSVIAIQSYARNLVAGDTTDPSFTEVFVHNISNASLTGLLVGETVRASVSTAPGDPDGTSGLQVNAFSLDNSYVSFVSTASNLVLGDTNSVQDVFVFGINDGTTARADVDTDGDEAVSGSRNQSHALSRDGSKITFDSNAINFEDPTGEQQVYVVDNPLAAAAVATPKRQIPRQPPRR